MGEGGSFGGHVLNDCPVRETVRGLEAGDEHNVLVDARQVLKKYKLRGVLPGRGQPQSNTQPWSSVKR